MGNASSESCRRAASSARSSRALAASSFVKEFIAYAWCGSWRGGFAQHRSVFVSFLSSCVRPAFIIVTYRVEDGPISKLSG